MRLSKNVKITYFFTGLAVALFVVSHFFADDVAMLFFKKFYGPEISWKSIKIQIGKDNFVMSKKPSHVIIVHGNNRGAMFPEGNLLVFQTPFIDFETNRKGLKIICETQKCKLFSSSSEILGTHRLEFVQADVTIVGDKRNASYYAFFYDKKLDLLVSYAGNYSTFKQFEPLLDSLRTAIANAKD